MNDLTKAAFLVAIALIHTHTIWRARRQNRSAA